MPPGSVRRPQGQRLRPAAPSPNPPPDYVATSIPIPFYPSSLPPPTVQQRQEPPPAPIPHAAPPPPPAAPTRPRHLQATRSLVKVQQRFALPAELRAVLQCMPPPKKPRLIAPVRRSASMGESKGDGRDRKRHRPASPSVSHLPVSMPPCAAAVSQDVRHLENAMARNSLSLNEIQQELRSQQHYPHPAATAAAAPSYRIISSATATAPSILKESVMKRRTNSSSIRIQDDNKNNNNSSSSTRSGGPRFTVRNTDGTEVVLDGGVDGHMVVEVLVGNFTGGYAARQEDQKVSRTSIPSPLPEVGGHAATTQDACTSPPLSLCQADEEEAMQNREDSSVASVASSVWFQHREALRPRTSPLLSPCSSSLALVTHPGIDELGDENHDDDNDDVHYFSVAAPTDLSLASLPLEWPLSAPSPLPSQSSHCFSSRESCFSPFVTAEERERVSTQDEEEEDDEEDEKEESILGTVDISVKSNMQCSSCCDCSSSSMAVAGDAEEGYKTDSSSSSSSSSYSSSSSSSSFSSSSSSLCSSSSSTISTCCHTIKGETPAFTATPMLPIRLLRW